MIFEAAAVLAAAPAAAAGRTWSDPVAYCRAVGTVDKPDRRYAGPQATDWMRRPFVADGPATGPDDKPIPIAWRCMDGRVKACTYGANVPCDGKANVSRAPNAGDVAYCRENPESDFIPLAAAGHDTIYDWSCHGGRAVAGKVLLPVDRRGYQKAFWRTVTP